MYFFEKAELGKIYIALSMRYLLFSIRIPAFFKEFYFYGNAIIQIHAK